MNAKVGGSLGWRSRTSAPVFKWKPVEPISSCEEPRQNFMQLVLYSARIVLCTAIGSRGLSFVRQHWPRRELIGERVPSVRR
jgi:hypothetical protein